MGSVRYNRCCPMEPLTEAKQFKTTISSRCESKSQHERSCVELFFVVLLQTREGGQISMGNS